MSDFPHSRNHWNSHHSDGGLDGLAMAATPFGGDFVVLSGGTVDVEHLAVDRVDGGSTTSVVLSGIVSVARLVAGSFGIDVTAGEIPLVFGDLGVWSGIDGGYIDSTLVSDSVGIFYAPASSFGTYASVAVNSGGVIQTGNQGVGCVSWDGRIVVVGNNSIPIISTDYGQTFAPLTNVGHPAQVAMSTDGRIWLCGYQGGTIAISTDGGNTWSQNVVIENSTKISGVCMSNDGRRMYVSSRGNSRLVTSNDGGVVWTNTTPIPVPVQYDVAGGIACSSDGRWLLASVRQTGYPFTPSLYRSADYGMTWTLVASSPGGSNLIQPLAISSSGQFQIANRVGRSSDWGVTWTPSTAWGGGVNWVSFNGMYVIDGYFSSAMAVRYSVNYGHTFNSLTNPLVPRPKTMHMSPNGRVGYLVAADSPYWNAMWYAPEQVTRNMCLCRSMTFSGVSAMRTLESEPLSGEFLVVPVNGERRLVMLRDV